MIALSRTAVSLRNRFCVRAGLLVLTLAVMMPLAAFAQTTHNVGVGETLTTIAGAIASPSVSDGDTLNLVDAEYLESGIVVSKSLIIQGQGASSTTVDANYGGRVFQISAEKTVVLEGLEIREGLGSGAGIFNEGTVTLSNCLVTSNVGVSGGGGFINAASAVVDHCTFLGNQASGNTADGGGIVSVGTLTVSDSTFSGNSAPGSSASGGAILCGTDGTDRTATIENCTFTGNSATRDGAGIYCKNDYGGITATVIVTNCTITGNSAGRYGGGVQINSGGPVALSLVNVTVAGNTAGDTCGGVGNLGGTINLKNSIVALNDGGAYDDVWGSIVSQDYNLIRFTSGGSISGDTTHNITLQDPLLNALADNGGPTQTCSLQNFSPAADQIPDSAMTVATDQRGETRSYNSLDNGNDNYSDIGAFEAHTTLPVELSAFGIE
ncbi:MAG TPA: right-handed parallel beta-helix repeat-containing protein [Candidatus Hydrogenedentes bacterium]|nr:right-handed parallel beta-helix repeat-containing protein [Candidatus Hydrogenedentota bacterium]HPG65898.1 right-handed parallel beta-helix repeat-containing protein [Candidatus Hydrogenedentota bacterium]